MRSQSLLLEITAAVIRGRLVGKDLRVGYVQGPQWVNCCMSEHSYVIWGLAAAFVIRWLFRMTPNVIFD